MQREEDQDQYHGHARRDAHGRDPAPRAFFVRGLDHQVRLLRLLEGCRLLRGGDERGVVSGSALRIVEHFVGFVQECERARVLWHGALQLRAALVVREPDVDGIGVPGNAENVVERLLLARHGRHHPALPADAQ